MTSTAQASSDLAFPTGRFQRPAKLDPEARQKLEGFAAELGIGGDQLLLTGFVPDRELSALYRRCGLFVFP